MTFIACIRNGNLAEFDSWVEKTSPDYIRALIAINDFDAFGQAAKYGHLKILNRMIELLPAQVDQMIKGNDCAAFILAIYHGYLDIVNRLIEVADPQQLSEIIKSHDFVAFGTAAYEGHIDIFNRLTEFINPEQLSAIIRKYPKYIFKLAAKSGDLKLLNLVIENLDESSLSDLIYEKPYTAFELAAKNGHLDVVNRLIDVAPRGPMGNFHNMVYVFEDLLFDLATIKGNGKLLELLIKNLKDTKLQQLISKNNYIVFREAAKNGHIDIISLLIQQMHLTIYKRLMISAKGFDAFREAANNGHVNILKLLLENTGDELPQMIAKHGAFAFARVASKGDLEFLNLLIEKASSTQLESMINSYDYEAFREAAKNGHLDVVNRLIEIAIPKSTFILSLKKFLSSIGLIASVPDPVVNMINANDYEAFREAAKNGHLKVVNRLIELAPDQVANMINANDYEAFREVAKNGHLEVVNRLIELAPDQVANMINANDYEAFREAAKNGHLEVVNRLIENVGPVKLQDMLTAQGMAALDEAINKRHQKLIQRLLGFSSVFTEVEKNNKYNKFLQSFIKSSLEDLQMQRDFFISANPKDKFDISDAAQAKFYYAMLRNLIKQNNPKELDKLIFLLDLPAVIALANEKSNELLRLAQSSNNREAAKLLLEIPFILETAQENDFYHTHETAGLDLKALVQEIYPNDLSEPTRDRYIRIDEESKDVHVYMPCFSGMAIGLDNTCKSVWSLKEFFGFRDGQSFSASLETFIASLEKDIALLRPGSVLSEQKIKRLEQLKKYQISLEDVKSLPDIQSMGRLFPEFPDGIKAIMSQETANLSSMQLSPMNLDSFLRTVHPSFSLRTIDKESLEPFLLSVMARMDFPKHEAREGFVRWILSKIDKPTIRLDDLQEILERETSSVLHEIKTYILDCFTPALRQTLIEMNLPEYDLRKSFIKGVLEEFGSDEDKTYARLQAILTNHTRNRFAEEVNYSVWQIADICQQLGLSEDELTLEDDAQSLIEGMLGSAAPELFDNAKLSPFQENFSSYSQSERLNIVIQFYLAEINIFCHQNGIGSQNFGLVLQNDRLQKAFLDCLRASTIDTFGERIIIFINEHYQDFKLSRPLEKEEVQTIQEDFNQHFIMIKSSDHFDEFNVLNLSRNGGFFTYMGQISVDYLDYIQKALPSHFLNTDPEMQAILSRSKELPVKLPLQFPRNIQEFSPEEMLDIVEQGYPLGFLLAKFDSSEQLKWVKNYGLLALQILESSKLELRNLRVNVSPEALRYLKYLSITADKSHLFELNSLQKQYQSELMSISEAFPEESLWLRKVLMRALPQEAASPRLSDEFKAMVQQKPELFKWCQAVYDEQEALGSIPLSKNSFFQEPRGGDVDISTKSYPSP